MFNNDRKKQQQTFIWWTRKKKCAVWLLSASSCSLDVLLLLYSDPPRWKLALSAPCEGLVGAALFRAQNNKVAQSFSGCGERFSLVETGFVQRHANLQKHYGHSLNFRNSLFQLFIFLGGTNLNSDLKAARVYNRVDITIFQCPWMSYPNFRTFWHVVLFTFSCQTIIEQSSLGIMGFLASKKTKIKWMVHRPTPQSLWVVKSVAILRLDLDFFFFSPIKAGRILTKHQFCTVCPPSLLLSGLTSLGLL